MLADSNAGHVALHSGRTRQETIAWLVEQAKSQSAMTSRLVVGLDFAFSYPAWFVQQQGATTIEQFWAIVAERGEDWLAACEHPFWGRRLATGGGRPSPANHRAPGWLGYRVAERLVESNPSSPFQIGGGGAVGTGSLRGIPWLLTLRKAGFAIWPFDPPANLVAMEIYPRSFTGPVTKSSREARQAYLERYLVHQLTAASLRVATESEDAFDAACSVIGMASQAADIASLVHAADAVTLLEGRIFPGLPITHGEAGR